MVDWTDIPDRGRRQRKEFRHPGRHAQALRTSGAGIVHREMMDLQRQSDLNKADTGRLKELRHDWNRNRKYTDAGMAIAGATTPTGAQDAFMRSTEDFRQLNPKAYGRMYPFPQLSMKLGESGGIWGSILREMAGKTIKGVKDYASGDGVASLLADEPEEDKQRYITETFGPHLENVPYGGPSPDEYEGPWPHEGLPVEAGDVDRPWKEGEIDIDRIPPRTGVDVVDDITVTDQMPGSPFFPGVLANLFKRPEVIEGYDTTYIDEPVDDISKYEDYIERGLQEPLPFDEGKEDFIRRQNEYVSPSSVFPGNVRQDPQDTEKWLRYLTAPELGSADPQGDFARFNEYPTPRVSVEFGETDIPPIIPFDDSGREAGIAALYGQGPQWAETNRRYEDEYRDHIARTGERMTYEEFARAWENVHQGKPHAGLR